jgi:hypothetical protein
MGVQRGCVRRTARSVVQRGERRVRRTGRVVQRTRKSVRRIFNATIRWTNWVVHPEGVTVHPFVAGGVSGGRPRLSSGQAGSSSGQETRWSSVKLSTINQWMVFGCPMESRLCPVDDRGCPIVPQSRPADKDVLVQRSALVKGPMDGARASAE